MQCTSFFFFNKEMRIYRDWHKSKQDCLYGSVMEKATFMHVQPSLEKAFFTHVPWRQLLTLYF